MVKGDGGYWTREQREGRFIEKPACGRSRVYLLHHAMQRMKQRRIAERELFNALNKPDETDLPTPAYRNRKHQCWYRSKRTAIHVIFELGADWVRVISVFDAIREDEDKPAKVRVRGKAKQRKPQRGGRRK